MTINITERPKLVETHELDHLPQVLQNIYLARGVTQSQQLERDLKHLLPYHTLKGLDQAVACLFEALVSQKKILILGDFDSDGATSSALAVRALRAMGARQVDYLVPNRFEYGYGLTPEIVDVAHQQFQPDVIITVDNGIASIDGVVQANNLGMAVIITDHHLPGERLPAAAAIVNPNQPGCEFPSKNLAGVGVIFYTLLALRAHCRQHSWFTQQGLTEPNMAHYLDLVALGTVADVVSLDHNNRILVHQGLARIRAGQCCVGILALLQIAKRDPAFTQAADLGFAVGPRLNAAGRLDDMSIGIACLLADDLTLATEHAKQLDSLNKQRREIESSMQQQALQALAQVKIDPATFSAVCLYDPGWHQGVIGIVASRIKEKFNRPVIAFAPVGEGLLKGSARSIKGVHMRDVLDRVATRNAGLIDKFGGHAMAAGLSLPEAHFDRFQKAFCYEVAQILATLEVSDALLSDGELDRSELTLPTAELIEQAGPWGQHFPEPLFHGQFILLEQHLIHGKYLKCSVQAIDDDRVLEAICFNIDPKHWPNYTIEQVELAYRLDINRYRGRRKLQLIIEGIRV